MKGKRGPAGTEKVLHCELIRLNEPYKDIRMDYRDRADLPIMQSTTVQAQVISHWEVLILILTIKFRTHIYEVHNQIILAKVTNHIISPNKSMTKGH